MPNFSTLDNTPRLIWTCHALSPGTTSPTHTHTPPIQRLLPNTRHFRASRPTERTYAAPLLLQGKGKHSYKLHNTQPDNTVSRQHDRRTNIYNTNLYDGTANNMADTLKYQVQKYITSR
jgi:hypothetical protein